MSVTREEAENAMRDMDQARTQSQELYGYQEASPYFLIWGVLWIVAAVLTTLISGRDGLIWLTVDAVGLVVCTYICVVSARRYSGANGFVYGLRYGATAVAYALFIGMALAVFAPVSGEQILTFIVMLISVTYVVAGLWFGLRYAVVGLVIGVLAAVAFFFVPAYVTLIAAGLGGGTLILTGLWLRRA